MFTREDYRNKVCTHEQYYGQMVTPALKTAVLRKFGIARLLNSDEHFNDGCRLHEWDQIPVRQYINTRNWALAGNGLHENGLHYVARCTGKFIWSMCDNVCIAKAAARALVNEHKSKMGVNDETK